MDLNWSDFRALFSGSHGRGSTKLWYESSSRDADRLCSLHDSPRGGSHASADDIDLYSSKHRSSLQSSQHKSRSRISPRASSLVHRSSLGIFNSPRSSPVSPRNCNSMLGEILRFLSSSRLVSVHRTYPSSNNISRIRNSLLSKPRSSQIRNDRIGNSRARAAQRTNRIHWRRGKKWQSSSRQYSHCLKNRNKKKNNVCLAYFFLAKNFSSIAGR